MSESAIAFMAAGIGVVGTTCFGAMWISKLAIATVESIARQPEAATDIRGAMIITAAMIEGISLLALVICFLLSFK
ncbi:MAG: ATP synthase F0 subunit C [candidate division KSB1 bacterium]|nr:ATP synthase F0 subunit C [candidate division KSB1 bacterium]